MAHNKLPVFHLSSQEPELIEALQNQDDRRCLGSGAFAAKKRSIYSGALILDFSM